jgi:PadR family transcriptional regulator, regulatory protein AphA
MSINNAILGILSYKSLTGYDLKKIIQESPFMHWSGNNNQIYKSLVELLNEGFLTNEVHHQESSPSKKIYTITEEGRAALKNWVLSPPEPPEFKKTFLIQLAWADQLNTAELNTLLTGYENEVRMQIVIHEEKKRRAIFSPARTTKEVYLWSMIYDNLIASYKNELDWIQKMRKELRINIETSNRMGYRVVEKNDKRYVEYASAETPLRSEQDALELVAACFENDAYLLMLHEEMLTDDFFNLRTGIAGQVLQKFSNYHVKVAVILRSEQRIKGKFKELLAESNKGNAFKAFNSLSDAEEWLLT